MRELARRVGVSAAAPYRHFKDKQALIQAVAATGFALFLEAIEAAKAGVPSDGRWAPWQRPMCSSRCATRGSTG